MTTENKPRFSLPRHIEEALSMLGEAGYEAFVVGGAVRDLLRGVAPHDYDITTNARPEETVAVFSHFRTVPTGIAHGTVTVVIHDEPIEITTYRVDGDYTDSRHPDAVFFTRSLREDTARRDFTVNAMAYNHKDGLIDFFGGKEDLSQKILRTVGDPSRRFTEDALRVLRGLRFSAVLGYRIEKETARAIFALKDRLMLVASERIREEFVKLLCGEHAAEVLREYREVIAVFLPEIIPTFSAKQYHPCHDFDIWEHTLNTLSHIKSTPILRLAAFFHDIGKPPCFFRDERGIGHFYGHEAESAKIADDVMRRLRFDRETIRAVVRLIEHHGILPTPNTRQFQKLRSRHGDAFLTDWLALVRADRMGQKKTFSAEAEGFMQACEAAAKALLSQEERLTLKNLALRGEDVMALGYRGKEVGSALQMALEAVLSGTAENTKEALLSMLENQKNTPVECERKFLIKYPDIPLLLASGAQKSEITQTYLRAPQGVTARVRKRVFAGKTVYTHTEKRRITPVSAFEDEKEISEEEYLSLLKDADTARNPIFKTRYALPCGKHTLEIDVYPFWQRQAVLEIELSHEDEKYDIPPHITILREVTADKRYKNVSLSQSIPAEEAES